MKTILTFLLLALSVQGFSQVDTLSIDMTPAKGKYGFSPKSPIKVGGGDMPTETLTYLKHLKGPEGQSIHYKKVGKGDTYDGAERRFSRTGKGVLMMYEIRIAGKKKSETIYFDQYRYEKPKVLKGYTWK